MTDVVRTTYVVGAGVLYLLGALVLGHARVEPVRTAPAERWWCSGLVSQADLEATTGGPTPGGYVPGHAEFDCVLGGRQGRLLVAVDGTESELPDARRRAAEVDPTRVVTRAGVGYVDRLDGGDVPTAVTQVAGHPITVVCVGRRRPPAGCSRVGLLALATRVGQRATALPPAAIPTATASTSR